MLLDEIMRLNTLVDNNGEFLDYKIKTIPLLNKRIQDVEVMIHSHPTKVQQIGDKIFP